MSTKSIKAPQYRAQLADATNVFGLVQTVSPDPTPSARLAMYKALVPELTATENYALLFSTTAFSKAGISGP